MNQDFSHDQSQRDNQQLSLAHIAVEKLMEEKAGLLNWVSKKVILKPPAPKVRYGLLSRPKSTNSTSLTSSWICRSNRPSRTHVHNRNSRD